VKDEVNLIKQQNNGANRRGNTICKAVWNVRSNFDEFVDENAMQVKMTMILQLLTMESG
jgi:hypothetical protein